MEADLAVPMKTRYSRGLFQNFLEVVFPPSLRESSYSKKTPGLPEGFLNRPLFRVVIERENRQREMNMGIREREAYRRRLTEQKNKEQQIIHSSSSKKQQSNKNSKQSSSSSSSSSSNSRSKDSFQQQMLQARRNAQHNTNANGNDSILDQAMGMLSSLAPGLVKPQKKGNKRRR